MRRRRVCLGAPCIISTQTSAEPSHMVTPYVSVSYYSITNTTKFQWHPTLSIYSHTSAGWRGFSSFSLIQACVLQATVAGLIPLLTAGLCVSWTTLSHMSGHVLLIAQRGCENRPGLLRHTGTPAYMLVKSRDKYNPSTMRTNPGCDSDRGEDK